MNKSLFAGTEAIDLYTLVQTPAGAKRYKHHLSKYVTEDDFAWLSTHGVDIVRIPIGYWVFDGDGALPACISRLDWALRMAQKYNILVLLDLHSAKGSQNGKDHSGKTGRAEWFEKREYRTETADLLCKLARRYHTQPSLWGIQLLNEPRTTIKTMWPLLTFYRRTYREIAKVVRPGTRIIYPDSFAPLLFSNAIWHRTKDAPVLIDVHRYHFSSGWRWLPIDWFIKSLRLDRVKVWLLQRSQDVILGEWSGVVRHQTARQLSTQAQRAIENRLLREWPHQYSHAAATFYWTYKAGEGIWSYRWLVEQGRITTEAYDCR